MFSTDENYIILKGIKDRIWNERCFQIVYIYANIYNFVEYYGF